VLRSGDAKEIGCKKGCLRMRGNMMRLTMALCLAAGTAGALADGVRPGSGLAELQTAYPGTRVHTVGDRVLSIYGKPMTGGDTPAAAAAEWLSKHGTAFGVGELDLRELWAVEISQGAGTVFAYHQYVEGLPVELSVGRIAVRNGEGNHVVYAAGQLSNLPEGGFEPMTVNADEAIASVQARPAYANMPKWGEASLVAYDGRSDGLDMPLVRAWKFRADAPDMIGGPRAYTFFVDAASGALLFVRNEILNIDISGRVTGKGTPGVKPDSNQNLPVDMVIDSVRVVVQGGNNAYTNDAGDYTVTHGGNQQVSVSTTLDEGRWVNVNNQQGVVLSLSQNVTPPGPANFQYNASPAENNTAQINAFIHQTLTHDYIKDRAPGFNNLDVSFPANVNLAQTCNAHYDGASTNFYHSGGGCVNTAYSTVVAHEYGHHIVNRLFLAQDAFGEGFGDVMGIMLYDVGIVGEDFFGPGGHIRNIDAANKQYPCNGGIHDCGQVLGGVWRDIALNYKSTYGSNLGLEMARQLNVDWAMETVGGVAGQAASPTTAIEALMADDIANGDGDIDNGTPNYDDICAAFDKHNIDCPPILLLAFDYPDGLPSQLLPGQDTEFRVNVTALTEQPMPGSGELVYRIGGGQFTTVSMDEGNPNQYTATLPAVECLESVDYYVQAKTASGILVEDPQAAPGVFNSALAYSGVDVSASDAFESDSGWVSGAQGDTATTGKWNRMNPNPTDAQPGDDHTANGTICWVTDGAGGQLGDFDVDNGKTTLVSKAYDLAGKDNADVSYWRWYSNDTGATPNTDVFRVDASNDGGQSWKSVEIVGPGGPETHAGWFFHEFKLANIVAPTANVKFRFIAEDAGEGSLVEAAIDDFQIQTLLCGDDCYADCDGSGGLDLFDFLCFQNDFVGGGDYSDCEDNNVHDLFDFLCFQNEFVGGC
jgi:hypothetical protein